jgi:hypothetical protein
LKMLRGLSADIDCTRDNNRANTAIEVQSINMMLYDICAFSIRDIQDDTLQISYLGQTRTYFYFCLIGFFLIIINS